MILTEISHFVVLFCYILIEIFMYILACYRDKVENGNTKERINTVRSGLL
jgi:hypothetical protein